MDGGANLRDTSALMAAKAVLVKTGRTLATAIEEAQSDAERFGMWLDGAGPAHWEGQRRLRTEKLNIAKAALFRKQIQMTPDGRPPSVIDEKKAVQRAQAELEHAERCLRSLRKWAVEYQRVLGQFRVGLNPLSNYVESTIPTAVAQINRMACAVDAYLATQAGTGVAEPVSGDALAMDTAATNEKAKSMKRAGTSDDPTSPTP